MSGNENGASEEKERMPKFRKIMRFFWVMIFFFGWFLYRNHKQGKDFTFDGFVEGTGLPREAVLMIIFIVLIIFGFASFMFMIVSVSERNAKEEAKVALKNTHSDNNIIGDAKFEDESALAKPTKIQPNIAEQPYQSSSIVNRPRDKSWFRRK